MLLGNKALIFNYGRAMLALFLDFRNTKAGVSKDDCKNEAAIAENSPRQVAQSRHA